MIVKRNNVIKPAIPEVKRVENSDNPKINANTALVQI